MTSELIILEFDNEYFLKYFLFKNILKFIYFLFLKIIFVIEVGNLLHAFHL